MLLLLSLFCLSVAVMMDLERFTAGGHSCGLLNVPSTLLCDLVLLISIMRFSASDDCFVLG